MSIGVAVSPSTITCKPMCAMSASGQTPGIAVGQLKAGVPEPWTQACDFPFKMPSMFGLYHL